MRLLARDTDAVALLPSVVVRDERVDLIDRQPAERGGREYNIALGQRRAEGVKRIIVRTGTPGSLVIVGGTAALPYLVTQAQSATGAAGQFLLASGDDAPGRPVARSGPRPSR